MPRDISAGSGFFTEWLLGPSPAVVAIGEADGFSAQALSRALHQALRTGPRPITLDLSRVTFIDGTALGAITSAAASYPGQPLKVSGASPFTVRLFRLVGMEHLLAA